MPIEVTIDHGHRLVTATARGTLTGEDVFGYQRDVWTPPAEPSKFAIVATSDESFGLGRMYETYRRLEGQSTKEVGVFRSLNEALEFLGAA